VFEEFVTRFEISRQGVSLNIANSAMYGHRTADLTRHRAMWKGNHPGTDTIDELA
jgi:hypothetical protein